MLSEMYIKFVSFFVLLISLCLQSQGQKSLNINNGFPHTDSYQAVQDNSGFVWFATLDGLVRYDGLELRTYKANFSSQNSLASNRISALVFDQQNDGLWIGTEGGGIDFFDLVTEKFIPMYLDDNARFISALFYDSENRIWAGTEKGLYLAHIKKSQPVDSTRFIRINEEFSRQIVSFFEDHHQRIYIASGKGIYKIKSKNIDDFSFENFLGGQIRSPQILKELRIKDSYYMLIGDKHGLFCFNFQTGELDKIRNYAVLSLLVNSDEKNVWVGTVRNGLETIKQEEFVDEIIRQPDKPVASRYPGIRYIFKDSFGTVFLCTIGQGVSYSSEYDKKFATYPAEDSDWGDLSKQVICFSAVDPDYLWIGTRGEGLALLNRKNNSYQFFSPESKKEPNADRNYVSALYHDKEGNLWMGTYEGLYFLHSKNQLSGQPKFERIELHTSPVKISKIKEDKNGMLWIASSNGILLIKDKKLVKVIQNTPGKNSLLADNIVNDLIIEKNGSDTFSVWVGSRKGLNCLTVDRSYKVLNSTLYDTGNQALLSNWVSVVLKSKDEDIVVGTLGGGLNIFKKEGKKYAVKHITSDNGLLTDEVETVLEDEKGNLWIGSVGLTKFDRKNNKFHYYDVNDGLQSNAFKVWSAFKMNNGELVFGGINGFNIFSPDKIVDNPIPPKVAFIGLTVDNKPVKVSDKVDGSVILDESFNYTDNITLNHKIKSFSIQFAGVHTQSSTKETYRYMLEGFDEDWIYANSQRRFAAYSNLRPGKYKFIVTASNGDGVWGDARSITIKVNPSFWQSKYSYFLYFLILAAIIYFYTRYTIIRTTSKNELALQRYKQEHEVRAYEEKLQFFTNISHELRTPLTLIISPLEQIFEKQQLNREVREKLDLIYKNASRLKVLINQLLDMRRFELGKVDLQLEETNILFFVKQIFIQFEALAQSKDLKWQIGGNKQLLCKIDRNKIDQVFLNLFSNAVKFSPSGSEVNVEIGLQGEEVEIRITNTNTYIDLNIQKKIFDPFYQGEHRTEAKGSGLGLSIVKYLVEMHQGRIDIISEPEKNGSGAFTTFIITLPGREIRAASNSITINTSAAVKKKIVVAEDHGELRNVLVEHLQPDYDILEASDGKSALELIKKHVPDLILTDVMMPIVDGVELIKAVKKIKYLKHIPIIIISAKGSDENKIEGLQAMANDYIAKPFNLKILSLKIRNLISSSETISNKVHLQEQLKPAKIEVVSYTDEIFSKVMNDIEQNLDNSSYSVAQICENLNISRSKLFRIIKSNTGQSINGLIIDVRLKCAAQLLQQDASSVAEVMFKVGFENASYFNRAFKQKFGETPRKYALRKSDIQKVS